jgi:hypothetical protein
MVATLDQVRDYWRGHAMRRWPEERVASLGIAGSTRDVLVTVGFPTDVDWTLRFSGIGTDLDALEATSGYAFCIDYCDLLFIDQLDDSVRWQSQSGISPVNASLLQFARCLVVMHHYRNGIGTVEEAIDAWASIDDTTRQQSSFWDCAAMQMRDGML